MGGEKCVVVDERLAALEPLAFRFLEGFPRDSDLVVRTGRRFFRTYDEASTTRA